MAIDHMCHIVFVIYFAYISTRMTCAPTQPLLDIIKLGVTMRKMALVVFLFLIPTFSFAFGDATPTALTNLRWRVASAPELSGCVQMTDIVLDVYTANTYQGGLFGYATCNTASGPLVYPMTGTLLVTQAGYGISLYVTDMRLFCTLSSSTLSSNACQIYQIAGGNLIGSFSMTFVP